MVRQMQRLWNDEAGIEASEVAMLLAIVIVVAAAAYSVFAGALGGYIRGLPAQLGFGG